MIGNATLLRLALAALVPTACEAKTPAVSGAGAAGRALPGATAAAAKADDPEMEAAKARARAELPGFLSRLGVPPPGTSDYQVKFDLVPGDTIEYIWATDLKWDGKRLTGRLGNKPEMLGYAIDQQVAIPLGDIIDWGYVKDGRMIGHYTTAVLLSHLSPEEAAGVRSTLGWR